MSSEHPMQPEASGLYYAMLCGFHGLVKCLILSCLWDIDANGGTHYTALHAALLKGYFNIALLLLKHGVDVNALDYEGWSPLHLTSQKGCHGIVEFILNPHVHANMQYCNDEVTMDAGLQNEEPEVGQILLGYGVDVDSHETDGWNPLKSALQNSHLNIMQLLL
jgi:ankyrin repeat protein